MALLPLVIAPDPRLKMKSTAINLVDDEIKKLFNDMLETMYHYNGVGLAAVQTGVLKRVVVIDLQIKQQKTPLFFANPEISFCSADKTEYNEGCLSFPGQYADLKRPSRIKCKFLNYHNQQEEIEADGLLSTALQHEIDHLNGVVFVDYLSMVKRDMIIRKVKKLIKLNN